MKKCTLWYGDMISAISRRERNRLERRDSIVEIAKDVFLNQGYEATSMSAIAAMLGGSKATLWNHFPSKEALFAAVLDNLVESHRAELESTLRPGRDLRATLSDFAGNFMERILAPQTIQLHRLVFGEAGRFPEVGRLFFERAPQPMMRRLEDYFAACVAAGTLRNENTRTMVDHLIGLTQSTWHQRLMWNVMDRPTAETLQQSVVAAVDAFMRSYGREAPSDPVTELNG